MTEPKLVPLQDDHRYSPDEMKKRAREFNAEMQRRRSVRQFSERPVDREIIEQCLRAAGSAPSGANRQPWRFVVVESGNLRQAIRRAAEAEETEFYRRRISREWQQALEPLATGPEKPFLEQAPCLIAVFVQRHRRLPNGRLVKNYYPLESVGIATGILLTAVHHAGLAALTYTPPRMRFLNRILERPAEERPFVLLVVGYPAEDAVVPELARTSLEQIAQFV